MNDICEQCGKSLVKKIITGRDGIGHKVIEAVYYAPTGIAMYQIGKGYTTPFHLFCSHDCVDVFIENASIAQLGGAGDS